ncbi:GATA zinc finger domain-containing protein 14-like [Venturia canescens]|uniref:GATA zinc finger domain-containing protein 14-like n=1 Tax=Venturia canescens TaxID=32260 RepID=UPI001C9D4436|nr:GATA zinc finger domain-containing protein 14-like [Venturia canescens]
MLEIFCGTRTVGALQTELYSCRQRFNESVKEFGRRVEDTMMELIDATRAYPTLNEAITAAIDEEKIQQGTRREPGNNTIICNRCNKKGHLARDCRSSGNRNENHGNGNNSLPTPSRSINSLFCNRSRNRGYQDNRQQNNGQNNSQENNQGKEEYTYRIEYNEGKRNTNADALSRIYAITLDQNETTDQLEKRGKERTRKVMNDAFSSSSTTTASSENRSIPNYNGRLDNQPSAAENKNEMPIEDSDEGDNESETEHLDSDATNLNEKGNKGICRKMRQMPENQSHEIKAITDGNHRHSGKSI